MGRLFVKDGQVSPKVPIRVKAYYHYLKFLNYVYKIVPSFSLVGGLLSLRDVDTTTRYRDILTMVGDGEILEVGASILSPLAQLHPDTVTLDIGYKPGVMILASASDLPLKDSSFDTVVAVDVLEHLPRTIRDTAIREMIRVAKGRVILSTPLEDGREYVGRQYDLLFSDWYRKRHHRDNQSTSEHLTLVECSPNELYSHGFKIMPYHNARLWFAYMRMQYWIASWPLSRLILFIPYIYYWINMKRDHEPPYWGGICVLDKGKSWLL